MVSPFLGTAIAASGSLAGALAVAFVLGLRHATDPDHLVAVSTLVAGRDQRDARVAGRLGAAWGVGHGLTLLALGLPIVLLELRLPDRMQQLVEAAIGLTIAVLGVQLLRRWRCGAFHVHVHAHGPVSHAHVHSHATARAHAHGHGQVRSVAATFAIGCLHGVGGSAAVGILVVAGQDTREAAALALAVLAAGTAVSMTAISAGLGAVLTADRVQRRLTSALPALGAWGVLFGAWYGFAAWDVVPYPF